MGWLVLELARGEEDAFVLLLFIYDVELNATQKSRGSIVYWAGWVREREPGNLPTEMEGNSGSRLISLYWYRVG